MIILWALKLKIKKFFSLKIKHVKILNLFAWSISQKQHGKITPLAKHETLRERYILIVLSKFVTFYIYRFIKDFINI